MFIPITFMEVSDKIQKLKENTQQSSLWQTVLPLLEYILQ